MYANELCVWLISWLRQNEEIPNALRTVNGHTHDKNGEKKRNLNRFISNAPCIYNA